MSSKKGVLLDFNMLLWAYFDNTFKTGIFWSQYYIMLEMLKNYINKFDFYAFCNCDEEFYNNELMQYYPEFKNIKYKKIQSTSEYYKYKIKDKIKKIRSLKKKSKHIYEKIKFFLKINYLKIKKIKTFFLSNIKPNLDNINIYQSFFEPIPKNINEEKHIKKYIIVHDIIPFTNPEYIVNNPENYSKVSKNFEKRINHITEDTTIFTDSTYTKNKLLECFPKFKNNKIIVNFLAADKTKYLKLNKNEVHIKTLKKYNIPEAKKYILSLSSLNKRKNLNLLVDSYVSFIEKNRGLTSFPLLFHNY